MKIVFSIYLKLLAFILPLVCLPIAILGFFSIKASEDRVNRLVRHEQMVKVKAAAEKIKDIFSGCQLDLETITGLPVMEDYQIARSFRLEAETQFNREKISRLLKDFITRHGFYYQIRILDNQGWELIKVKADSGPTFELGRARTVLTSDLYQTAPGKLYVSDILFSDQRKGYIMHWATPIYSSWHEYLGGVIIDLDYEKIIQMIKAIRVGDQGYAFVIDDKGRVTGHPFYAPYEHSLETYPEPSLKELIQEMITGASGWKTYVHQDVDKVAAFTPVTYMGWSIGVTIPLDEFGKEAHAISVRVIQVGAIVLICAVLGASLLAYYLLRPVRRLVAATNKIAQGDLNHTIPVQTRDELGDLTRSFNHMVRNLSRIQQELVRSEKLISLGRLSAGVAHEIRNPLNAIKGAIVHIQRRRRTDPLVNEYTQLVSEEIDRLNTFVTEFLYFARQSKPNPVPTDLNQLIVATQKLFQKQASQLNIRFHNQLSPHLPDLLVDPHQIERVIVNVLINAMDALPDGGDIIFTSSIAEGREQQHTPEKVCIEIRDTGMGISEEHLDYIFDPFYSTKEAGTGIGLPLSLSIVENHNGRMTVQPRQTGGVKVTIELPMVPTEISSNQKVAQESPHEA
ncbi:MAG: HAMP domain-containing protein [Desulfobacteraceae bacterium]|jgi:two-component system, NtrC family, sensor kinase